jgi:hypothetical protein
MSNRLTFDRVLHFFTRFFIPPVMTIKTQEDLQYFLDVAGYGVLAAFENASDETLPVFTALNAVHYADVTLAYCSPQVLRAEGFWVHRFTDHALLPIADTFFNESPDRAEMVLSHYAVPEIFKADDSLLTALEERIPRLAILVLDMKGAFYLSEAQIELARSIRFQCGLAVCFEVANISNATAHRYNFPEIVFHEEFRIVDFSDGYKRYRMSEPLTLDNAIRFCFGIVHGDVQPLPDLFEDPIDSISADEVNAYTEQECVVVGFCEGDVSCRHNLGKLKRELRMHGLGSVKVAEFRGKMAEWPVRLDVFAYMPSVIVFNNGALMVAFTPENASSKLIASELLRRLRPDTRDAL